MGDKFENIRKSFRLILRMKDKNELHKGKLAKINDIFETASK